MLFYTFFNHLESLPEEGSDQTSITQKSCPNTIQSQFEGLCLSKLRRGVVQEFLSLGSFQSAFSLTTSQPHNLFDVVYILMLSAQAPILLDQHHLVLALLISLSSDALCYSCFDLHAFAFLAAISCPFFRLALVVNSHFFAWLSIQSRLSHSPSPLYISFRPCIPIRSKSTEVCDDLRNDFPAFEMTS
jgi:hypothetical protein